MFQLSDASIAGRAEQASDAAGIMAVVDVESLGSGARIEALADGALAALGLEHFSVGPMFDAVFPLRMDVSMSFRVLLAPVLAAATVTRRVLVAACSNGSDGAWLAGGLLAIVGRFVGAKLLKGLDALAPRAPLLAVRSAPSWVCAVAGFAIGDLALATIAGQSVRAFFTYVERGLWFRDLASGAKFLGHVSLLGRKVFRQKTLSLSTQGVSA